MIAGYVRLSRDDDRQHYSSIENQKLIILQFAQANGLTIDCWFEDDGISGYHFNRPQFQEMMRFLSEKKGGHTIDAIIIKDDCVIIEPTQKDLENQGFVAGSICF